MKTHCLITGLVGCLILAVFLTIFSMLTRFLELDIKSADQETTTSESDNSLDYQENWESLSKAKRKPILPKVTHWTRAKVNYLINFRMSSTEKQQFDYALEEFHEKTCVRFQPWNHNTSLNWVSIERDNSIECGNSSVCMKARGHQYAKFNTNCMNKASFIHELGHSLCLTHENLRQDNIEYLTFDNCPNNVAKLSSKFSEHWGIYDYASQLHYPCDSCVYGRPSFPIPAVCGESAHSGLSVMDVDTINQLYDCQACNRHRWIPLDYLKDNDTENMYNFGNVDLNGRKVFPCRAFYMGEVAVGMYILELKTCTIASIRRNETVKVGIKRHVEILTIPGGFDSNFAGFNKASEEETIYQYELKNILHESKENILKHAIRGGSFIKGNDSYYEGYIAFDTLSSKDMIGTAWNQNGKLTAVFPDGHGHSTKEKIDFKILVCSERNDKSVTHQFPPVTVAPKSGPISKPAPLLNSTGLKRWTDAKINYVVNFTMNSKEKSQFYSALTEYHKKTCVRFHQWNSGSKDDWVSIERDNRVKCVLSTTCQTKRSFQFARFNSDCMDRAIFIHGLGRLICLTPEHTRSDSGEYLKLDDNCEPHSKSPIGKGKEQLSWGIYDYASQFHFPCYRCLSGVPPYPIPAVCGEQAQTGLSVMDVDKINRLYDCQACHRHRWIPIQYLETKDKQNMYNFGNVDSNGRKIFPCRAFYLGEVAVGMYTHELKICKIPSLRWNKNIKLTKNVEILTIPGGLSSRCGDFKNQQNIDRTCQYELQSNLFDSTGDILQQAVRGGSIIMGLGVYFEGFIAFGTIIYELGKEFQGIDVIGTAWNRDGKLDSALFPSDQGNITKVVRHFKVLVCKERYVNTFS